MLKDTRAASDIWYCLKASESQEKPDIFSPTAQADSNLFYQRPKEDKVKFLACRLCTTWSRPWKNCNGQIDAIRNHIHEHHWSIYRKLVLSHKLKGWEKIASGWTPQISAVAGLGDREVFSLEGFYDRLLKWIVVDDQSLNVVDSPELRDLLLFISIDLTDSQIPHRTTLTNMIIRNFQKEYDKLLLEMKSSEGRVSFTSDCWSRTNLAGYMAVTAHYLVHDNTGALILKHKLVAFRHVSGSHTGEHLANVFMSVLQELAVLDRIGMITLDNASNNNTMMEGLERRLVAKGIAFHRDGNRIRCFPHVTNIATETGLKLLTTIPSDDREVDSELTEAGWASWPSSHESAYNEALENDVVAKARKLVSACRASGQRREALEQIIVDGNSAERFTIENLHLLRDVDTRWSSILIMIDRLITIYPAVRELISAPEYDELADYGLSDIELQVLSDIRMFLDVFHSAQQIVSAEKTPTLSIVIPIYEELISMLQNLKHHLPNLKHAIQASIDKLEEYMSKARSTKVYVLAMLINPQIKLHWSETHWSTEESNNVKKWVQDAMVDHQRGLRMSKIAPPTSAGLRKVAVPSHAARAQAVGLARMKALAKTLSADRLQSSSTNSPPSNDALSPSSTQGASLTPEEQLAQDMAAVREELRRWTSSGIMEGPELEGFDLVRYWQSKKHEFPILYRIALDVIPAQASAVPCERVFSSGKETDTNRRSNIGHDMMEILQILKYLHRNDRVELDFTGGLLATKLECSVIDVDPDTFTEMLKAGNIEGLEALISASYVSPETTSTII